MATTANLHTNGLQHLYVVAFLPLVSHGTCDVIYTNLTFILLLKHGYAPSLMIIAVLKSLKEH